MTPKTFTIVLLALAACARGVADEPEPLTTTAPQEPPAQQMAVPDAATAAPQETDVTNNEPSDASAVMDAQAVMDATDDASVDAALDVGAAVVPPLVDGIVQPNEYGVHVDGHNQQAFEPAHLPSTTWYMTWTETDVHVAITAANLAEGAVLYLDHGPLTPSTSGTNAEGSLTGYLYDGTKVGSLPFRADFVAYFKAGYNEYRRADGANGWSAPTAQALSIVGSGTTREITIPWAVIRQGGRPASFAWLGYVSSSTGYVYGGMPSDNPRGAVGLNAAFGFFYRVDDATPASSSKPFALKSTL